MRFLKVYFLFISFFFFGAMASAKESNGSKPAFHTNTQSHFHKAEPRSPQFADLVIEEVEDDSNENEDDTPFQGSLSSPTSSDYFSRFSHALASRLVFPTQVSAIQSRTASFILFRNIRL
jgi:hypothetical protein